MSECKIKRIITFKEAVQWNPVIILDENEKDVTKECGFSWSTDGSCWTSWTTYDNYLKIASTLETDFYLRILISGGLSRVYYNGLLTDCYNICADTSNVFLSTFCDSTNLFQPYQNLDCALLLQQQMSDSIVCMLGVPIYYLRVSPNQESVDYTFKEWSLHNVVDIKQMKLMIPDGQMPSSNPRLTDFDFDWEIDWETELSKRQFANAFGDTVFPKQRDLVYVPLMKRLWEVNAAYDEKNEGLLWRPTTWKLALVKYNEKTNVDKGAFEDLIDGWLVNKYEDTFGELERAEQERTSAVPQLEAPKFAATNLYNIFNEDGMRKQFTKDDISIQDKIYCHYSNIVARNLYRFRNANGCVTYQKPICGKAGWISFIIETGGSLEGLEQKDILNFGNIDLSVTFKDDHFYLYWGNLEAKLNQFSCYMVILKWDYDARAVEFNVYPYTYRQDIPQYLLKPEMYYWDFENSVCSLLGDFTSQFNNDYFVKLDQPKPFDEEWLVEGSCQIHPWPLAMTNIKYYRGKMNNEDIIKECLKYTTNNEQCVINDLARPLNNGHGYSIK